MIQRLVTTLHELVTLQLAELPAAERRRLFGDCADAVRLELDCPQQSLTPPQRSVLTRLGDLLEDAAPDPSDIGVAAQRAHGALGLADPPLRDRAT